MIARSSAFQFRGAAKAVRNVAGQLNVSHLLDGSVRRSGNRVRITAQLVDCASEVSLWSDRFDRQLDDIFALQDEIAEAVARALEVVFSPGPAVPEIDLGTYELFLRAQSIITEGGRGFDDSGAAAAPLLEQVVQATPDHARAWELLANAYAWMLRSGAAAGSYEEGRDRVVAAAQTALRLDPSRGGAYEALAMLEPWGNYEKREELLKQALRVGPNDPGTLTAMSTFCWSVGRIEDALDFAERACVLNPLFPAARLMVAQMQSYMGNYAVGVRMMEEIHQRWPDNLAILISLIGFSAPQGYWDQFDRAAADVPKFSGAQRQVLEANLEYGANLRSLDPAPRLAVLERLRRRVTRGGKFALNEFTALCTFGLQSEALDIAEQASFDHMFRPDGPLPGWIFPGIVFSPAVKQDPRSLALCARLGLCNYWVATDQWPDCARRVDFDYKAEARRLAEATAA